MSTYLAAIPLGDHRTVEPLIIALWWGNGKGVMGTCAQHRGTVLHDKPAQVGDDLILPWKNIFPLKFLPKTAHFRPGPPTARKGRPGPGPQ